jgi:hypothetical protein
VQGELLHQAQTEVTQYFLLLQQLAVAVAVEMA